MQLESIRQFKVRQKEIPKPDIDEVLVEIKYVGICGSDLHVYHGSHPKVKPPAVLGHECTGIIYDGNNHFLKNIPVAVNPLIGCGVCEHCQINEPNICLSRTVIGFQRDGGLSPIIAVPKQNILPLSENFPLRTGILYEPLAVVIHAAKQAKLKKQQDVIITGAGTIGLLSGIYIQDNFDVNVSFVEIDNKRIEFAESLGFHVYKQMNEIPMNTTQRPVFFECTGNLPLLKKILSFKPAAAEVVIVSTFKKELKIPVFSLLPYETAIKGSQMYTEVDLKHALEILSTSKRYLYEKIIIKKDFGYDEVNAAYETVANSSEKCVKAIINMEKGGVNI